jgi:hypothetical protein
MTKPASPQHHPLRHQMVEWAGPAICVLAALTAFAVAYHLIGGPLFPNDDAFINLHNARVLWLGHDPAYRDVPALVGATSGVHLALLMLFESFIPADTTALFVLCAVIAAVYVLGLFAMCINVGCSRIQATLIALAGLILAGSIFQLLNGLDTGLAMAAVAWNIKLLTDGKRTLWLPVLCGAMPFIRPELGFLSIASMFVVLRDREPSIDFRAKAVALCVLAATPFLLWYWIDTGSPIPSTIGAKTYFFAEQYLDWRTKAGWVIPAMTQAVLETLPLFLCISFIRPRAVRLILLLFVAVLFGSYFWKLPSGFLHNAGRYLYPLVPVVLVGIACGLSSLHRRHRKMTLVFIAISPLFVPLGIASQFRDYRERVTGYRDSSVDMVRWMNANLAEGSVVMVHDAGYVAYAGHFTLFDLVGLKTPAAAAAHKELTYPSAGKLRPDAVAKIAGEFQPRYLLVIAQWEQLYRLAGDLGANGWTVQEIYVSHVRSGTPAPYIYHLYRLEPPNQ